MWVVNAGAWAVGRHGVVVCVLVYMNPHGGVWWCHGVVCGGGRVDMTYRSFRFVMTYRSCVCWRFANAHPCVCVVVCGRVFVVVCVVSWWCVCGVHPLAIRQRLNVRFVVVV
jgi:hypothetical protein